MKKKSAASKTRVVSEPLHERTYKELVSIGGQNSDWGLSLLSEDSEVWQNAWALTSRVRDLFRCNPLYQAYRETLWANVLGSNGITLRMDITEDEERTQMAIWSIIAAGTRPPPHADPAVDALYARA